MTTAWVDGKDVPLEAFDCSVAWNDKAMARFVRALVAHRGHFTDSYTFSRPPHGRNDTTIFRVFLPATRVEAFKAEAQPQDFRLPPKVTLNAAPPPDADARAERIRQTRESLRGTGQEGTGQPSDEGGEAFRACEGCNGSGLEPSCPGCGHPREWHERENWGGECIADGCACVHARET